MDEINVQEIYALVSIAVAAGSAVEGLAKKFIAILHPKAQLTDDQINAIEKQAQDEDVRNAAVRDLMAKASA